MKKLILAIDADGTIWRNKYPKVGQFRFGARFWLRWLRKRGHILILNTCRECSQTGLDNHECPFCNAQWVLKDNGLDFDYYNENCRELIEKYSDTRKIGADWYFDDKAGFLGWWTVPIIVLWLEWRKGKNNEG
jgi:hypothetical protein